jgi:hypothetical protein
MNAYPDVSPIFTPVLSRPRPQRVSSGSGSAPRRSRFRALLSGASLLIALLKVSGARAAPPADVRAVAEKLYQDAYELTRKGRYAEACPKLEESDRLDPANGTKFELAQCYEGMGRPASAWVLYVTVADADKVTGRNNDREAAARSRAASLEPELPTLTIVVPAVVASLPGVEIKRNGVAVGAPTWGIAIPTDLGEHRVTVSAVGRRPWEVRRRVDRLGERLEITVPPLRDDTAPDGALAPISGAALLREEGSWRRPLLLVSGGVGVAGIALGSVFGATAVSRWSDVKSAAQKQCRDPLHFKGCAQEVADKKSNVSLFATASTIGFITGGAAIVGMALLWFSRPPAVAAPKAASVQIAPALSLEGAGGLVRGTF